MRTISPELGIALCEHLSEQAPSDAIELADRKSAPEAVIELFDATAIARANSAATAWQALTDAVAPVEFANTNSEATLRWTRETVSIGERDCPFAPPLADGAGRPDITAFAESSGWDFELVIFELDGGLLDTSPLTRLRNQGLWAEARARISEVTPLPSCGTIPPHVLVEYLRDEGKKVAVVTRSARRYARELLAAFEIEVDYLEPSSGWNKAPVFERVITEAGCNPDEVIVFGVDASDLAAADTAGAWTLGNAFVTPGMSPQPDVSWWDAETLLAADVWLPELRYAGEIAPTSRLIWHRGSLVSIGVDAWALGRYFTSRHGRHTEPLSRAVLSQKSRRVRVTRLAAAFDEAVRRLGARIELDAVLSVPPREGALDRFAHYRGAVCGFTGAYEVTVREDRPAPPNYKSLGAYERGEACKDRFSISADLRDMTVLLIDDVVTTGATIGAVREAAIAAGAARVLQLSFATTV